MKRIAYLIHWNEGRDSGVCKKVADQITMWVQEGYEVALCLFTKHAMEMEWRMLLPGEASLIVQHYVPGYKRMRSFQELLARVEHWSPDLIYHRFDLFYVSLPALLRKYSSVIEINTNDLKELSLGSKLRYYYHRFTRAWVLKAAGGFVFVSKELSEERHYKKVQP